MAFGDGAYGAGDMTLDIDIGRRQVVKAAASSHRVQVVTDAGVIMDFPCSLDPLGGGQTRRLNRLAFAWSRGRMTIWSMSTCDGRDATNPITSATSAATSGVIPA